MTCVNFNSRIKWSCKRVQMWFQLCTPEVYYSLAFSLYTYDGKHDDDIYYIQDLLAQTY